MQMRTVRLSSGRILCTYATKLIWGNIPKAIMFGLKSSKQSVLSWIALLVAILSPALARALMAAAEASAPPIDNLPQTREDLANNVVDWLRSQGGFFNENLSIQRIDQSDMNSPLGVFATKDIDPEERLIEVPNKCYISIPDSARVGEEDSEENMYHNICHLGHTLIKEMNLGTKSFFLPYITYLEKTQKPGQIPAGWSEAGKEMLRKVATSGSDLVDWIDTAFGDKECIDPDDPLKRYALEIVRQRAYDVSFIPIWDMVNHDNGRINVVHDGHFKGDGVKVRALKKIRAGEQLFCSYDMYGENDDWGTPEILRDFGFNENYPQRWVWPDPDIWFELHEKKNAGVTSGLEVHWYPGVGGDINPGHKREIHFLTEELKRLQEVKRKYLDESQRGSIPDHEWSTILRFHRDFTVAVANVIEAAINSAGVNTTTLKTFVF